MRTIAAVASVGALILAACGDDSDSSDSSDDAGPSGEAPDAGTEGELRVWLNGLDTPEEMRDLAIERFNEEYPEVTVTIEQQDWDGLEQRLNNVLPTGDTPDIVEMGNTQVQQYTAAGALVDLTDHYEDLGGDDLLDSMVEAGSYDGRFYAPPLYAGARTVLYRADLLDEHDIEVPTTLEEFVEAGQALQDAVDEPNFSGIYFPGRNWHGMLAFLWDAGGDIAVQEEDGTWVGTLDSDDSVAGLETVQEIMLTANSAPADSDDSTDHEDFCAGEIGMLPAPGWKMGQIMDEEVGCPDEMEGRLGVFALPGSGGGTAPAFLGGSNLGISANSDNVDLALEFLRIITGDEFQTAYAENGLIPARSSLLDLVEGDEATQAQADAAANSRFVPSSEYWAEVEGQDILHDLGTELGSGGDAAAAAEAANGRIEDILNQ
jgi:N,N'-diacetylchitobiose transport system substrate-binding protein